MIHAKGRAGARRLPAWILGCLLLAGCAAPRGTSPDAAETQAGEDKLVEAHAHYAQGMIFDMDNQPDAALEEFSRAALADPSNEQLVLELVRRYSQAKQPDKALELLQAAAAVPGASTTVFSQLSLAYARAGKQPQAIAAAHAVIKREPRALTGYQDLFIIALQGNRVQDALKALNEAAKVPNADAKFMIDLAGMYASLQIAAPALRPMAVTNGLALLKRAVPPDPPDPQLLLKRADAYNLLGAGTNAEQIYLQLLEKYGSLPTLRDDLHAKLADIYMRGHDSKKAAAHLQAILQDDPANSQVYYYLGSLAYDDQKLPDAIDYFQRSLLLNDNFEQAYYDLAGAQINFEKPRDALATLAKAQGKFSTNFISEFFTALAYVKLKDYTNAVGHFALAEKAARAAGTNQLTGYFYFEAGAACEQNGEIERAIAYFEKSLKLAPDMAEALNYYGYMLADRGLKLEKARMMIEKAVELDPKNAAYLDSLGWVLFKLGKLQDGLVQEQKAIQFSDDPDPTLFDHLGDIYAALKQPDKAREAWKKSLSLEPNDAVRKKLGSKGGNPADAGAAR
jgi:tetratricopeptide (TPR) repeat protein